MSIKPHHPDLGGVAITGLAGRFPGAANAAEFWQNLVAGKDSITRLSDAQLATSGYDAQFTRALPGYVAARGLVEKPEWFDRGFFGVPPKEAEVMDPQHRVFLEVAWEALEDAGCDPSRFPGLIGVFAGMSNNTYFPFFVRPRRDLMEAVGGVSAVIANEKDFLTTRLAYKLNLRGPALNIQTACSSSLVTVALACQSLLTHGCHVALAGGVSLTFPQERGYFYQEGSMTSADGYCRPFDARASGTIFSSGAGVVVLKRLADALAEGDSIYAVIKGQALNNDGQQKVSFAAPSVNGQTEVISLAQAAAGISPETISYIEAHGTATALGDPIEIEGLSQAFRAATQERQFCALGSVKGNIGHCDAASGITSLIKTALAFRYEQLPPSINCEQINPALHLEESPFYINRELRPWPRSGDGRTLRRAGVSSFGVGGTNAHLVLEEAPEQIVTENTNRPFQMLLLSAKTATALERRSLDLAQHLESNPACSLANTAWTLQTGRQTFAHRRAVIARRGADAVAALRAPAKLARVDERIDAPVALLFPGQGSQYAGMGRELYTSEPVFREALDQCADLLRADLGCDLRETIFASDPEAAARLRETRLTQPAIFSVAYALGQMWFSMGIQPAALLGHSVGEWAAATLAGVFSVRDAARLVAVRAQMVQDLPGGAMLAVRLPEAEAREMIGENACVDIAAINAPRLCVLSGPFEAVDALEARCAANGVAARRLCTSHAFHSSMMEPVVGELAKAVGAVELCAPELPIVSSVTGDWLSADQAVDPQYWAAHLRATVCFADAITRLCASHDGALLEVGSGQTLSQLARQCPAKTARHEIAHTLAEGVSEDESFAAALGRLALAGVPLDWRAMHGGELRRRVSLPTYPFERQRYFADLPNGAPMPLATAATDGEAPWETPAAPPPTVDPSAVATELATPPKILQTDCGNIALAALKQQLTDLSGLDLTEVPATASLLELGFDSLFMSQVALALSRKSGVKITLRQLLRELGTLDALAAHLGSVQPHPVKSAGAPPSSTAAPSTAPKPIASPVAHGPFRPLQRDLGTSISPRQQRWLDQFIARYAARTSASKAHTQTHRGHFADPRAVAGFKQAWKEIVYPIVVNRSAGARLWDLDENEWTDVTLSFGAAMLGHQPPFVVEAITEQLARGMEIGPTSPLAGEVAALLCEMTGMARATFCNTGSEAVVGALRVARTVTGRSRVVYFTESYHGIDNEVLGRRAGGADFAAIAPGILPEALANALILEYGDPRALEIIAAQAHDIAAVLVEPVQSRRPSLQPREFLHALRAITAQNGIALIFDEIITGFRCHPGGAQAFFGVEADIATFGKVIGGGLPIGAITGRAEFMDAFDGGQWSFGDDSFPESAVTFFAGTFVRHPLALAAARAVLTHLRQQGPVLQATLADRTSGMIESINAALDGTPFSAENFASNWLVRTASDFRFGALLFAGLRHRGIHIWEGRPCFVSTAHSEADLKRVVDAFCETAAELEAAGFFNRSTTVPRLTGDALPLTSAQSEVWLLCQQSPVASSACNETWTLRLSGDLDLPALRGAVQQIVQRHDALRSRFSRTGETLCVAPTLALDVPLIDFSSLPEPERDARFAQLRAEQGAHVFDLECGPLLAVQVVRLAPEEHALVFNAHHLACDGWSCDIFLHELSTLYSAASEGERTELVPAMKLRDYQQWEENQRRTPEYAAELAYWVEKFRATPPMIPFPGDRAHPEQRSFCGASEVVVLPLELAPALTRLGAQHGATFFTVLLATYQTLLWRLTGEQDLVVGVPSAGQNAVPGGEALVGHCVNMLPMRTQLTDSQSFGELLSDLQTTVLEAFEHQNVTFGTLLQHLALPRVPGRAPLIAATFNVDPPLGGLAFGKLAHRLEANPRRAFQFDFALNCDTALGGQLRVICNYNTDVFEAATVRRWLGHFHVLLEGVLTHADWPLARLPLLRADDPAMAFSIGERRDFPGEATLHALFESQVQRTPETTALIFEGQRLSYRQLNDRANQLANHLRAQAVGPDTLVGICMERSLEMVVGLLGILKAGGAYLPLDPDYPVSRLAFMMEDARAPVLLTQEHLLAKLPITNARTICLDTGWDTISRESATAPAIEVKPEHLAYVIYTSGSTGQPKGAMNTHRGICNRLLWMQDAYDLTAEDRVLQKTPFSFDVSVWEFFWPLLAGATLVVARPRGHQDSQYLAQIVLEHSISTIHFVPSMLTVFLEEKTLAQTCRSLRQVICSGEALSHGLQERFFNVFGDTKTRLHNLYGPTEAAVDVTFWECERNGAENVVPIGQPIANTCIYLLDPRGQPVPVGVPGELHIGGLGVARGYLGRPELTAEKFVPDPFSDEPGARLYKTGDLARWRMDGNIVYLGRLDHQVKLRGFRIELGEIEDCLRSQPGVLDCAVTMREDVPGEQRLTAYVVPSDDVQSVEHTNGTSRTRWLTAMKSSLPDYMVPAAVVVLSALPLTSSGKLDRRALPKPERTAGTPGEAPGFVAPRTPLEELIAGMWRKVLNLERISVHDDFFDLGGESLIGMRLVNLLRAEFGNDISAAIMFKTSTIAGLAELLRTRAILAGLATSAPWSQAEGTSDKHTAQDPSATLLGPIKRVSREAHRVKRSALGRDPSI